MREPSFSEVRLVAAFRLPVSVKSLCAMVDGLTSEYGKGRLRVCPTRC